MSADAERLVPRIFFGLLALIAVVYVALQLTPSSYGVMLGEIGATKDGPLLGSPRPIRSDEWAVVTPLFQAAVRNNFHERNETSFYREDLRSVFPIPLRNWSLIFRPQLWAFFITSPATAYSFYFAFLICATLAGYYLLLRELGADQLFSVLVSLTILFTGYIQIWGFWTVAGIPFILLILLRPVLWSRKALLLMWLMPATALGHPYFPLFVVLAPFTLVVALAARPALFRSLRDIGATVIGVVTTVLVVYVYFRRIIPIMSNTVYPGHHIVPPGTVPLSVVLSQIFPFLVIHLSKFRELTDRYIVEISTIGSFLPLLTLCLARYREIWNHHRLRAALTCLLAMTALMTFWQIGPAPLWIGRLLLWDIAGPERLFLFSGLLLHLACALVWGSKLISVTPMRIGIFALAGPIASVLIKYSLFPLGPDDLLIDICISLLLLTGCVVAAYWRESGRATLLLALVAAANLIGIGRFNPLQSAVPIFRVPETEVVKRLRKMQDETPGHILIVTDYTGATPNGIGFRSVSHLLPAPELAFFRQYFPTMDPHLFNFVFNRYAHIVLTNDPMPNMPQNDVARVPMEVFVPVANVRQGTTTVPQHEACVLPPGGSIDRTTAQANQLTIAGWAPWKRETAEQGIRTLSAQSLRVTSLLTIPRPDIAELIGDYTYVKAGFELHLESTDGHPIRTEDMTIIGLGTEHGDLRLMAGDCR